MRLSLGLWGDVGSWRARWFRCDTRGSGLSDGSVGTSWALGGTGFLARAMVSVGHAGLSGVRGRWGARDGFGGTRWAQYAGVGARAIVSVGHAASAEYAGVGARAMVSVGHAGLWEDGWGAYLRESRDRHPSGAGPMLESPHPPPHPSSPPCSAAALTVRRAAVARAVCGSHGSEPLRGPLPCSRGCNNGSGLSSGSRAASCHDGTPGCSERRRVGVTVRVPGHT